MSRVAITGVGIVDALGNNYKDCFNNLLGDYDPIGAVTCVDFERYSNLKTKVGAELYTESLNCVEHFPLYMRAGLHTVTQALTDAQVSSTENVAVIFSTLVADSLTKIKYYDVLGSGKTKFPPKTMLEIQHDYLASVIAQQHNFNGPAVGMNTSCSTFLTSLDYARRLVDDYDYVVVGGSDTPVDPVHLFWFQQYHALSTDGSRPFDQKRNGFVLGNGAGCIILEREDRARARGAKIYGFVAGLGMASEASSLTGVNHTAARQALDRALKESNMSTVDAVNAHATSTVLGDELEYNVIKERLPNTPIYSVKGKIGHTMAACGVIELIYGLASMEFGIVPRNFNLTNPLANDEYLLTNNLYKPTNSFLKNSYAFGGRCASLIIQGDYE